MLPQVATAIDWAAEALERGGRVLYMGAGTSGRLGVLDASECPPTFGVSPDLIVGPLPEARRRLSRLSKVPKTARSLARATCGAWTFDKDLVVGLAASGRTPMWWAALCTPKQLGARPSQLPVTKGRRSGRGDLAIEPVPGPEVLTGSTRLKAGTVQKLILNMISTGAMVKIGKVYQNLMVDVQQTNEKLVVRGQNIVMEATGCTRERAVQALADAGGHVKTAIVSVLLDCDAEQAAVALERARGHVRAAVSGHEKSNDDAQ
ncbi:MAG: N-acetylmuramic acid 6-phosphate etherase [Collinsella sp.]